MLLSAAIRFCVLIQLSIWVTAENNIAFELSDLTKIMRMGNNREYQLEAFKSVNNDKIITEENRAKYSRLFWVSLGYPRLIKTPSWLTPSVHRIFHENKKGFYAYIQTLTQKQRQLLLSTASTKYKANITEKQIVHLVLKHFTCNIQLYEKGKRFLIRGEVFNFHDHPLRMNFIAPLDSRERRLYETELELYRNGSSSIRLMCSVESPGQRTRVNTLTITSKSSQQIGIKAKLFGTSRKEKSSVYVTRKQMSALASELYSRLSIVEEYGVPEHAFSEAFVQEFINQMAEKGFSQVPFEKVLSALSMYTLDFSEDLKPDIIKRNMSKIFKIENTNNKSHIVVNDEQSKSGKNEQSLSVEASLNVDYGLVSVGTSVKTAKSQSKEWAKGNKSLKDQLCELNRESTDNVEWTIDGTKVVPKSMNVAKINQAKFANTLRFERIRRYITDAPFQRKFSMYTHSPKLTDEFYRENLEKVTTTCEKGMQAILNKMDQLQNVSEVQRRLDNAMIVQILNASEVQRRLDNAMMVELLNASEVQRCVDNAIIMQSNKDFTVRLQRIEDNLLYRPPLQRMLAMVGNKEFWPYQPMVLCSPLGNLGTTSERLSSYQWTPFLTFKKSTVDTNFPAIILPTFMGGGVISILFRKWIDTSEIDACLYFRDFQYNKDNVILPMKLGVNIKFFKFGTGFLIAEKEGKERIEKFHDYFKVFFKINATLFDPNQHLKIDIHFYK